MGSDITSSIVTVLLAIIGVAIIAVLVSQSANTSNVLSAGGNAFSSILGAATSPITGGSGLGNLGTTLGSLYTTGGPAA